MKKSTSGPDLQATRPHLRNACHKSKCLPKHVLNSFFFAFLCTSPSPDRPKIFAADSCIYLPSNLRSGGKTLHKPRPALEATEMIVACWIFWRQNRCRRASVPSSKACALPLAGPGMAKASRSDRQLHCPNWRPSDRHSELRKAELGRNLGPGNTLVRPRVNKNRPKPTSSSQCKKHH